MGFSLNETAKPPNKTFEQKVHPIGLVMPWNDFSSALILPFLFLISNSKLLIGELVTSTPQLIWTKQISNSKLLIGKLVTSTPPLGMNEGTFGDKGTLFEALLSPTIYNPKDLTIMSNY